MIPPWRRIQVRRTALEFAGSVCFVRRILAGNAPNTCSSTGRLLVCLRVAEGATEEVPVSFTDKVLTCRDCGEQFTWTAGEQEFYQSRGLLNPPTRCGPCRQARKAQQSSGGGYSGGGRSYSGNGGGYSGGGSYSGGGGGYDRPQRQMYDAICAECGQPTQVPFQPRGDRPVYCRDCFNRRRAMSTY